MSKTTIILVFLCALAACRQGPSGGEAPILNVLTWSDYFGSTTLSSFREKYGIEVRVDYIDSNEELVAKLETQPGQYDLVFPSAFAVTILQKKNLLVEIDRSRLKNAANLLPAFARNADDPQGTWSVPYTVSYSAVAVNREKIKEPVTSFGAFFERDYGKTILLLDDMRATIGMALKAKGYSANTQDAGQIGEAAEALIALKPRVHIFASADLQQLMASGEVALSYAWSGDIFQATRMNPSVEIVLPEEGTLLYTDCMAIPASARHSGNAMKLIDHILDGEVAAEISNEIFYPTPNKAAEPFLNPEAKAIWENLGQLTQNPKIEQVRYLGEAMDYFIQAWNEIKLR